MNWIHECRAGLHRSATHGDYIFATASTSALSRGGSARRVVKWRVDDKLDELAMRIFVELAAQHTVRHGAVHESRPGPASSLARESFKLAEAFYEERDARERASSSGVAPKA